MIWSRSSVVRACAGHAVFLDLAAAARDEATTRPIPPTARQWPGNRRGLCVSWGIEFQAEHVVPFCGDDVLNAIMIAAARPRGFWIGGALQGNAVERGPREVSSPTICWAGQSGLRRDGTADRGKCFHSPLSGIDRTADITAVATRLRGCIRRDRMAKPEVGPTGSQFVRSTRYRRQIEPWPEPLRSPRPYRNCRRSPPAGYPSYVKKRSLMATALLPPLSFAGRGRLR